MTAIGLIVFGGLFFAVSYLFVIVVREIFKDPAARRPSFAGKTPLQILCIVAGFLCFYAWIGLVFFGWMGIAPQFSYLHWPLIMAAFVLMALGR